MKLSRQFATFALASAAVSFGSAANAEIKVGVSLSSTGPAAALGVPERNTIPLLPTEIAGHKVTYIVLDDGTDASQAGKNARKLISEDNVDILFGSSATPPGLAMAEVADEYKVPQIAAAPVDLPAEKDKWVFRAPQHVRQMAGALVDHMKANGVKRLGFIGYADAYGETWLKETKALAEAAGITLEDVERFNRNDTSVTGQAVKLVAAKPDAILIAASGTPSVLPQDTLVNRGFKGQIYQTHGTATKEYIRVGGKLVEGTILPVGPVVVASQLPDTHPSKKMGEDYTRRYEEKYGAGSFSSFGAHIYDAYLLLAAAAPEALKTAQPGTPEFRAALRDALEQSKEVVGLHGVFNMSPTDHFGHDARSSTLIRVENGDWKVVSK